MRNWLRILAVTVMVAGCGSFDARSLQDVSAWGIGWQLKAPQNRIGRAFPPVVQFLRTENPAIDSADPPEPIAATYREIVLGLKGADRRRVERRLIGVFTVAGQGCAMRGYPVRDGGAPVAAFITLDSGAMAGDPTTWTLCRPVALPAGGTEAFQTLLLSTLARAVE